MTPPEPQSVAVLGIDPGFASIGWTVFHVYRDLPAKFVVGGIIHTKKAAKKSNTSAPHDNFRRAREISFVLRQLMFDHGIRLIAAEAMSFPRSSSIAAKMAMTWGALSMLSVVHDPVAVLQASPQAIKLSTTGKAGSTKKEVEDALVLLYPSLGQLLAGIKDDDHEHMADAAGAVHVALPSDEIRLMRSMLSS